ncbi:hypothetical protein FH972_014718 [Carpinus fangiana]|uniref:Secreted protein n=1 Tax=Carpinus fangiana TaxID=176857 RepID=A0A5N6RAF5_9ROSI|nr:hypothetical protein FH972_014718 [Carpinus fangiana]
MVAHLLPYLAWALTMIWSSSGENGRCSTSDEIWLHHRSRHDFLERPGIALLIADSSEDRDPAPASSASRPPLGSTDP